jgi:RHS repeat-associated protein
VTKTTFPSGNIETYGYDADNNLTSKTDRKNQAIQYVYDALNRLTQKTYPDSTTAAYTYDLVGKILQVNDPTGTYAFAYDNMGRLTQVTMPNSGGTATFEYDPFGRRVQKVFTTGGNNPTTTSTNYLYDGDNAIETVDQNGNVLSRFAQDEGVDHPLAESTASGLDYYEQDGLGSVTSLTNSSGALALSYTYDSFGKITTSSGSVTNPFRYTGRDFDPETGLYYYRARYYDPATGRFLSEDRIRFWGDADFYLYAHNNPVLYVDPLGQKWTDWIPGHWVKCKNWGYYCLQAVFNMRHAVADYVSLRNVKKPNKYGPFVDLNSKVILCFITSKRIL